MPQTSSNLHQLQVHTTAHNSYVMCAVVVPFQKSSTTRLWNIVVSTPRRELMWILLIFHCLQCYFIPAQLIKLQALSSVILFFLHIIFSSFSTIDNQKYLSDASTFFCLYFPTSAISWRTNIVTTYSYFLSESSMWIRVFLWVKVSRRAGDITIDVNAFQCCSCVKNTSTPIL